MAMAVSPVATIIELHGQPKGGGFRASCADSIAIPKGTVLRWAQDPADNTVSGCLLTDAGVAFAGIANEEKEADDGATTIGMWTKGVFGITVSGAALVPGSLLQISGANLLGPLTGSGILTISGGGLVGKLLDTTTAASEVARVAVGIY